MLNKPRSTGSVRIASDQADDLPQVELNHLSETTDRKAMSEIVRRGCQVMKTAPLAGMFPRPIAVKDEVISNDARLTQFIMSSIASGYHFTGTCKMAAPDKYGVVNQAGMVYGTRNLHVIDASVIPIVPAANVMLPTIMTAERLSTKRHEIERPNRSGGPGFPSVAGSYVSRNGRRSLV